MKFKHPSGKEIEVEPFCANIIGESGRWWCIDCEAGSTYQRTYGRACGVFRRMMKRKGWDEVVVQDIET